MGKARPSRITPEVLEREAEVLKLRRGGLTFDMIAERLGYAHASGAHKAYVNACKRIVQQDVEELRSVEIDRLDIAQAAIWPSVLRGESQAINTLVRIVGERARLLGLYASTKLEMKQEVTVYQGGGDIDREVARLAELLAASAEDSGSTLPVEP